MFSSGCALSGFWFRRVSSAIAVLPVWRSPMINSRWPRPIGVSASIALRPVAIGSPAGLRGGSLGAVAGRPRPVPRHPAGAVLQPAHFPGLDVVEAVDAGNAVADGQHLSDFGNFSLLAEILDLILEDRGNFRGADVHQPASFIAFLIELSLVRSELSTMRLPSLTTRPPMMEGSTFTLSATSLPVTDFSAVFRASRFLSLSASATVTSAVASPLNFATSARKARITSVTANRRRLPVSTFRKLAEMPEMPALSSTADSAFD